MLGYVCQFLATANLIVMILFCIFDFNNDILLSFFEGFKQTANHYNLDRINYYCIGKYPNYIMIQVNCILSDTYDLTYDAPSERKLTSVLKLLSEEDCSVVSDVFFVHFRT